MAYNEANDRSITTQDYVLKKVNRFKYLGLTMSEDGELDEEDPEEDPGTLEKLEEDVWSAL